MRLPSTYLQLCILLIVLSYVSSYSIRWHTWVRNRYNYEDWRNVGQSKCALINIVMDESGSMATEQDFLKETALPQIVESLYTTHEYDHVFLSSNGYGSSYQVDTDRMWYRHIGASRFYDGTNATTPYTLEDPSILNWLNGGTREDGYHAMRSAMYWIPLIMSGYNLHETCECISRNMILVTDEVSNTFTQ